MGLTDHYTAHLELPDALLNHYLLGRQLAMEQVLRELVTSLPNAKKQELIDHMRQESADAMDRVQATGRTQIKAIHASDCGYACGLVQMGF